MKKRNFKAPSGQTLSFTELGFGTAPIGNLYRAVDPEEAQKTLEGAWKAADEKVRASVALPKAG